jgi:GntR family transcriptional regulator/MocR family aminotransferase
MTITRRLQLLEWARRSGAAVFEDDYDSEYRYSGRPVPAMQGLDAHNVVLFAGSFNKVMFPSLRIGYLVVPPNLVDRVTAAISVTSRHAPVLEQAILCDFIVDGHFGRHLRRMRQVYADRFQVLKHGMDENLGRWLTLVGAEAGLQVAAWLRDGLRDEHVAKLAAQRNLQMSVISRYSRKEQRQGLHLGFAAFRENELRRAIQELSKTLREAERTSATANSGTGETRLQARTEG